jgi:hypothetical protein
LQHQWLAYLGVFLDDSPLEEVLVVLKMASHHWAGSKPCWEYVGKFPLPLGTIDSGRVACWDLGLDVIEHVFGVVGGKVGLVFACVPTFSTGRDVCCRQEEGEGVVG